MARDFQSFRRDATQLLNDPELETCIRGVMTNRQELEDAKRDAKRFLVSRGVGLPGDPKVAVRERGPRAPEATAQESAVDTETPAEESPGEEPAEMLRIAEWTFCWDCSGENYCQQCCITVALEL